MSLDGRMLRIEFSMRMPVAMTLEVSINEDGEAEIHSVYQARAADISVRDIFENATESEREKIDKLAVAASKTKKSHQ